jgi:hypothetical protein
MPKGRRQEGAVRHSTLNSGVLKDVERRITFGNASETQEGAQFTKKILMEAVPGDTELWLAFARQIDGNRVDFILPE